MVPTVDVVRRLNVACTPAGCPLVISQTWSTTSESGKNFWPDRPSCAFIRSTTSKYSAWVKKTDRSDLLLECRTETCCSSVRMTGVDNCTSDNRLVGEPQAEKRTIIGSVPGVIALMNSFQKLLQAYEFWASSMITSVRNCWQSGFSTGGRGPHMDNAVLLDPLPQDRDSVLSRANFEGR